MKKIFLYFAIIIMLLSSTIEAQTIVDVQQPVWSASSTTTTSQNPNDYVFSNTGNPVQGVNIYLPPATSPNIPTFYLQHNGRLAVNVLGTTAIFGGLYANYDNTGWVQLSAVQSQSFGWWVPPIAFRTYGTTHNLKIRYTDISSGNIYFREYNFNIVKDADEFHNDQVVPGSNFWRNKITVWNPIPNSSPAKPLLLVEGFDPYNQYSPESYIYRASDLVEKLLLANFKIYVLDFAFNAQDMRNNAAVVHAAINYISSINSNQEIVLAGASMGGVISRYTLAKDESFMSQQGLSTYLPVSHFISLDSPQQGATVSTDLTAYLKANDPSNFVMNREATLQLLSNNQFDQSSPSTHSLFFSELNSLNGNGYPTHCINIGVAFSRVDLMNSACGSKWFGIQGTTLSNGITLLNKNFYLNADECEPGSLVPQFSGIENDVFKYHNAVTVSTLRFNNPTFIKHSSALDIVNGQSKFCIFFDLKDNSTLQFHDQPPISMTNDIVGALRSLGFNSLNSGQYYNAINGFANILNTNLSVYGNFAVNANMPGGYSNQVGNSYPIPNTTYLFQTNRCNSITMDLFSGGEINLGSNIINTKGVLIIGNGSKLVLHSGSTVRINEGSKLIIEPGAELIVEPNATILLQGPNALFDVQGTINQISIQSGETLLIDKGTANIGGTLKLSTGSIIMHSNSHFISDNCKVLLNDVILTYNQDADFTLNGENALLEVQRTCNVNLSNGHTLLVKKGNDPDGGTLSLNMGVFNLNSNAAVVSQNCKIKLNDYTFNYYHNAQITLNGEQAMLQFGGILNLQPQADLHFSGDGYFGFNLKWMNNGDVNLHGDASNSITIQGNGKTDKILEVAENTYVKADESINMQMLKNGRVEFGDKATWLGVSSYSFTNLMAVSKPYPQSGNGFWVSAVPNHTIQQITFKDLKYGLRAYLMWGNAANLKVSDCTFDHCFNAFSFFDKGVSLTNIDFINCTTPIEGTNASAPNYLSNVTIRDAGSSFQEAIKISGAGTSALYMQNCSIPNGPNGYYKKGIYLDGPFMTNVKCSNVYGGENSMYIYNNSSVNLSPLTADPISSSPLMRFGGNNNFKSGGGINAVSSNLLILQDGYNDFSVDGSSGKTETIYGTTFSFNTVNGNRFLPAHNNKWFDELYPYVTSPSQNNTGIALANLKKFGGGSGQISVLDNSPSYTACASNPSGGNPGVYNERGFPLEYCPKCPKINGANFSDVAMNEAIQESLEESVDSINPDNLYDAFRMFYEIAATSTTYEENRVNWNSEFAYLKLKELFGSLAKENKLIPLDESNDYFIKLIEIEKRMIEISKEKDDDFHEFYYSVDMATTYRLIGKQEEALNILNNLAPCLRLKQEQVEFLNQWISIIQAEQLLKIGAIGIFDFDLYAGVTSGSNREFKKVGNTQANIDTIIVSSMQGLVPANTTLVQDNAGYTYSISNHMDSVSLNYHIQKSDAANVLQWEQDFDGRNRGVDSVRAILIDDNNFIYVTGKSWNGIDFDVLTVKFDTAGNRYWIAKYNDMEIGNDEPIAMEIDSNFKMKVYVRSFNDSVVKYKTIYYTQCDTNCAQNYRLRNVKNVEGKENLSNEAELTVYPIPSTDKVNISLHSTDPAALYLLRMYDVSGKLVYSKTISYKYVLDLNPYAKGIYQLIISAKDKMLKQRIVKE